MQLAKADENVAILSYLDVIDVRLDGSYAVNPMFLAMCRAIHLADPGQFDTVFTRMIRGRASSRGVVLDVDADVLAVAALEIATAEA